MKAEVKAAIRRVVATNKKVFIKGRIIGRMKVKGDPACPLWEMRKLELEHVFIRGKGDKALSLIHISEPTRLRRISYAVFCLKKKK